MQHDRERLKELTLYVCNSCKPQELGAVKLHKVLYLSDMIAYLFRGRPITGAVYRKRPHGPTCDSLLWAIAALEEEGRIRIGLEDYFGFRKKTYVATAAADASRFDAAEIALVDDVIDFVCRKNTAKTISEFSHNRAWELVEFGEELPYESAYLMYPDEVSAEALEWAAREVAAGADPRSAKNPLALEDYGVFRSRVQKAL